MLANPDGNGSIAFREADASDRAGPDPGPGLAAKSALRSRHSRSLSEGGRSFALEAGERALARKASAPSEVRTCALQKGIFAGFGDARCAGGSAGETASHGAARESAGSAAGAAAGSAAGVCAGSAAAAAASVARHCADSEADGAAEGVAVLGSAGHQGAGGVAGEGQSDHSAFLVGFATRRRFEGFDLQVLKTQLELC